MRLKDIEIGGRYEAKVSGRIQTVRIVELREIPPASWSRRAAWRTLIFAINEATGRRITIRSPQRLRPRSDRLDHLDYADAAEAAGRGGASSQAAALWRRAAETCPDADRRQTYLQHATRCAGPAG
jgi:hypothetical protein